MRTWLKGTYYSFLILIIISGMSTAQANKRASAVSCSDDDVAVEGHALVFPKGTKPKADKKDLLPLLEQGDIQNPMSRYAGSTILNVSLPRTNICDSFDNLKNFVKDEKLTGLVTLSVSGQDDVVNFLNGITLQTLKEMKIIKKRLTGKLKNGQEAFFILLEFNQQLIVIGMKRVSIKDARPLIAQIVIPPSLQSQAPTPQSASSMPPQVDILKSHGLPSDYFMTPDSTVKRDEENPNPEEADAEPIPPQVIRGIEIPRGLEVSIPIQGAHVNDYLYPTFPGPRLKESYKLVYKPALARMRVEFTEEAIAAWLKANQGKAVRPKAVAAYEYHEGADFSVPTGTPVVAPMDGYLYFIGAFPDKRAIAAKKLDPNDRVIVLEHQIPGTGKTIYTAYHHLSAFKFERKKKQTWQQYVSQHIPIKKGDLIGLSGNSGYSTGSHLHFEIRLPIPPKPAEVTQSTEVDIDAGFKKRISFLYGRTWPITWAQFNKEFDAICVSRKRAELENALVVYKKDPNAFPLMTAGNCSIESDEQLRAEYASRFQLHNLSTTLQEISQLPKPYGILSRWELEAQYPNGRPPRPPTLVASRTPVSTPRSTGNTKATTPAQPKTKTQAGSIQTARNTRTRTQAPATKKKQAAAAPKKAATNTKEDKKS